MREGAARTYLSMLRAGLAERFDPLPKSVKGLGMAASFFGAPIGELGPELCQHMRGLGLDAASDHEIPSMGCGSYLLTGELELDRAPLASIAIATRHEALSGFWRGLPPGKLASIADTALPLACMADNLDAISALLAAGASPDTVDAKGMPVAARCASPAALALLVQAGADLSAKTPASPRRKGAASAHEWIMAEESQNADARAMRQIAVDWALARPPSADPMAELAASAFKALASGNKGAARAAILAMGGQAALRRDAQGDSLASLAARHRNYPELSRLLGQGADPFEVCRGGDSVWGVLLASRIADKESRVILRPLAERRESILSILITKRKYKSLPWARVGPGGHTLIESIMGRCPMAELIGHMGSAEALGWSPRSPLSTGMDMSCALALENFKGAFWVRAQPLPMAFWPSGDGEAGPKLLQEMLRAHPLSESSPGSKAALATALASLEDPQTAHRPHLKRLLLGAHPELAPFEAALLDGFEELGRQGAPLPKWNWRTSPETELLAASSHERGALKTVGSAPSATDKARPRL